MNTYVNISGVNVQMLMYSEMNDNNDIRDGENELGLFCYYKVLALPVKWIVLFKSELGSAVNVY